MRYALPFAAIADWAARYPPGTSVHAVQVIHRHGPRAPSDWRMPERYSVHWPHCRARNALLGIAVGGTELGAFGARGMAQRRDGLDQIDLGAADPAANCIMGQLTDIGAESMVELGMALRAQYITSGLLPIENASFRSTVVERAIHSVRALAAGLFPDNPPPVVTIRDMLTETSNLFMPCPEMTRLSRRAHTALSVREHQLLVSVPRPAGRSLAAGINGGIVDYVGLFDTLASSRAHGVAFPGGYGDAEMRALDQLYALHAYAAMLYEPLRAVRLYCGRFVLELLDNAMSVYHTHAAGDGSPPIERPSDQPPDAPVIGDVPILVQSGNGGVAAPAHDFEIPRNAEVRLDRDDDIPAFSLDEDDSPDDVLEEQRAFIERFKSVAISEQHYGEANGVTGDNTPALRGAKGLQTGYHSADGPCKCPFCTPPDARSDSCGKENAVPISARKPIGMRRISTDCALAETASQCVTVKRPRPRPIYTVMPTIHEDSGETTNSLSHQTAGECSDNCTSDTPKSTEGGDKTPPLNHVFEVEDEDDDLDEPFAMLAANAPVKISEHPNMAEADTNRLQIYSGHDSTLACLLAALGVAPTTNPPFSASLIIEHLGLGGRRYVRVLYNNEPLVLPFCMSYASAFPTRTACRAEEFERQASMHTCTDILLECGIDEYE